MTDANYRSVKSWSRPATRRSVSVTDPSRQRRRQLRDDGRQLPIRHDNVLATPREDGRQSPTRQDMVLAMLREDGRQSPIRQDEAPT